MGNKKNNLNSIPLSSFSMRYKTTVMVFLRWLVYIIKIIQYMSFHHNLYALGSVLVIKKFNYRILKTFIIIISLFKQILSKHEHHSISIIQAQNVMSCINNWVIITVILLYRKHCISNFKHLSHHSLWKKQGVSLINPHLHFHLCYGYQC